MREGNKISHATNVDSPNNKEAVHKLKNIIDDKDEQVSSTGEIAQSTEGNN